MKLTPFQLRVLEQALNQQIQMCQVEGGEAIYEALGHEDVVAFEETETDVISVLRDIRSLVQTDLVS